MKRKAKSSGIKKHSSAGKTKSKGSHEFETMSQIQNRYGKGRQQNGSDGGDAQPQGNNH